jgi:peptidoglycan/xylan/chitin deacetylase (PgdA/CDA1 family)
MRMTRRTFLKLTGAALFASELPHALDAKESKTPDRTIAALLYHDIANPVQDEYTVSPASFSAQLEWLYANGYRTLSADEIEGFLKDGTGRAVMITFDDGYTSFMDYAFPLLNVYGFQATVNIIGTVVENHLLLDKQRTVLSWDECRYLAESGLVDIGCHSYALHSPGGALAASYGAIAQDLTRFQELYKKELGRRCTTIAWPYGIYDKKCIKIALDAGFSYLLTSNEGYIGKESAVSELPRLNMNDKLDLISFQQYIGARP